MPEFAKPSSPIESGTSDLAGAHHVGSTDGVQTGESLRALEQAVETLPEELHRQTDRLTGMYLKNLLFSAAGRELIDSTVPGPKRFVLFDCQHAGAANNHGAGERIDRYFGSLQGIFERAALEVGIPHVALRLGGDEFALVIPAEERASRFLKRVVIEIEKSRAQHVGPGTNELGSYVVERDTMRTVRNDYRREAELHHEPFSAHGFLRYMHEQFVPRGNDPLLSANGFKEYLASRKLDSMLATLREDPQREALATAIEAGYLQKYIALALITGMSAPAGRFSMSSVEVGASPRWEDYHLAEGVAAKRIQATKDRVFTVEIEPALSVNPNFVIKHHEADACRAFVERESAYAELRATVAQRGGDPEQRAAVLHRLVTLAISDPNLAGVVRGDLVRDIPAAVVLGRSHEGPLYALVVNVRSFGVVNNSKSYVDADRMLEDVVQAAATEFPPLTVIRNGGGRVVFLGTQSLDLDDVVRIQAKLEQQVKTHLESDPVAYQRMLVEYGERFALNSRWRDHQFRVPSIDFGTCSVALAMVKVEGDLPLDLGNLSRDS